MKRNRKMFGRLIIFTVLIIMTVSVLSACAASPVTVPDVVGMTKDEAQSTITEAGLVMTVSRERFSNDTPKDSVDKMDTPAGTELKKDEEVKVVLSLGKGVAVPDMGVLTGAEAQNLLTVIGLNPIIEEEFSDDVPAGNIISYTDGGKTLPVGSDVTLTVSKGPQS